MPSGIPPDCPPLWGTASQAQSYKQVKKLLKDRGVDASLVDSCMSRSELLLVGTRQGVLRPPAPYNPYK